MSELAVENQSQPKQEKLGEWLATAICGNDITSSCLYVSALALLYGGPWGPICLLLVAGVLWLFRGIYAEVVGALPLNGGAYNALLNTTSKFWASFAACLTILSYLATAVISASEAVHYAVKAVARVGGPAVNHEQVMMLTVGLLFVFALLVYRGIGESARVALCFFVFHMTSLLLLLVFGGIYVLSQGTDVLIANWNQAPPKPTAYPLLFGFCVAMLGISGFESSANFVEEQKPKVFPKTLRNMWIAVSFFNPMICLLALSVVPLGELTQIEGVKEALLAEVGQRTAGTWLSLLISVDAALVLSGAVITSFVGVTGLVHRMTLDRCLPQLFLRLSRFRTFKRIIFVFFLLSSLLLYLAKDLEGLGVVYTISFLSVMLLFTVGNALLKAYRGRLPRETKVTWLTVIVAGAAVIVGLTGNISLRPQYFRLFLYYFIPTFAVVMIMLRRTVFLKIGIYIVQSIAQKVFHITEELTDKMEDKLDEINSQQVVFFTRGDAIANLNEAMLYVRNNEHTNKLKVVTIVREESEVPPKLAHDLQFLNDAYPEIDVEFVVHRGTFSPRTLKELSKEWSIPLNFMFIGSPGDKFPHALSELGGVRLII